MGMFNTLLVELECENCHHRQVEQIQFKFGDTWMFTYHIGDRLLWGGNDLGQLGLPLVKVLGTLVAEQCPVCQHPCNENYDVILCDDIIRSINKAVNIADYLAVENDWCVIEE